MGIKDFLFGHKDKNIQQSLQTPEQSQALQQLLSQLGMMSGGGGGVGSAMQYLQGLMDPNSEQYKNFEQPYIDQYNQQTIPGLAERFAGAGGAMGGGLSSSGFGQALGAAGGNLQTQLAQLKSQMQRQAAGDIFGQYNQMSNQALGTRTFENQYQPGSTGLVGQGVTAFAQGLGSSMGPFGALKLGSYMGGSPSASGGFR